MASFIRKVLTASGGRAVEILHKRGRRVVGIEHIGSAHDEEQLAVLMELARQRLHEGQEALELPPATGAPLGVEQSRSPGVAAGLPHTGRPQRGRHRDGRDMLRQIAGQRPRIAIGGGRGRRSRIR